MRWTIPVLVFLSLNTAAQITITENDFPSAGDTIRVGTDNIHNFNGNLTGADYTWNYSNLQASNQRVDTFVSVFSTLASYNVIFNPLVANLATPNNNAPSFPALTITDSYDFYKLGSSYYRKAGFGAKINGVPTPVKYDNPELILNLPAVYGNSDSSESYYGIPVPGIGYFGQTIKRKYIVDGWGTLIIPYGTFSVIRVKSTIQIEDTIYSEALGFGYSTNRPVSYEYSWIGNSMDIPLLSITGSGNNSSATFRDSILYNNSVVTELNDCKIFPNPAVDILSIIWPDNKPLNRIYRIIDLSGKIRLSWLSAETESDADLKCLTPGIYMLEIQCGSKKAVYTVVKL